MLCLRFRFITENIEESISDIPHMRNLKPALAVEGHMLELINVVVAENGLLMTTLKPMTMNDTAQIVIRDSKLVKKNNNTK
jgi:hypothetical protein